MEKEWFGFAFQKLFEYYQGNMKPKILSTEPRPEYVTALLIALPILIIMKRENI